MSLHYLVKYLCSKNCNAQELIEANGDVRLSHSKNFFLNICLVEKALFNSLTKRHSHEPYKKSHDRLYTTVVAKKKMLQQNAVHDEQLVSH